MHNKQGCMNIALVASSLCRPRRQVHRVSQVAEQTSQKSHLPARLLAILQRLVIPRAAVLDEVVLQHLWAGGRGEGREVGRGGGRLEEWAERGQSRVKQAHSGEAIAGTAQLPRLPAPPAHPPHCCAQAHTRMRMVARKPVSSSTVTHELTMENQWICGWGGWARGRRSTTA